MNQINTTITTFNNSTEIVAGTVDNNGYGAIILCILFVVFVLFMIGVHWVLKHKQAKHIDKLANNNKHQFGWDPEQF